MCSDMEFYNLLFREKYSGGNLIFLFDMSLFTIIIVLKFPESKIITLPHFTQQSLDYKYETYERLVWGFVNLYLDQHY